MIEFFNKLFGRQPSGATAKERLRLVLMSDHLSLAPEMVESMKRDLVDVISRYVEVDREKIDIHFEHEDKALAMLANIPITGVNRNGNGSNGSDKKDEAQTALAAADAMCHGEPVEPPSSAVETPPQATRPSRGPRRKRKKPGSASSGAPAPAT